MTQVLKGHDSNHETNSIKNIRKHKALTSTCGLTSSFLHPPPGRNVVAFAVLHPLHQLTEANTRQQNKHCEKWDSTSGWFTCVVVCLHLHWGSAATAVHHCCTSLCYGQTSSYELPLVVHAHTHCQHQTLALSRCHKPTWSHSGYFHGQFLPVAPANMVQSTVTNLT